MAAKTGKGGVGKKTSRSPAPKSNFDRDGLASWYAKRHFDTDNGVVRIFCLPTNAPLREIRFLEINKLIPATTPLEAFDFGVDIDNGANGHSLYVLDVTPDQWEAIQNGKLTLPTGWSLDGKQELRREAVAQ